jgi:salicylate hydroxylase
MVSISFADGTTATANLVIACDGIHSTIRSQFVVDKPKYSGRIAYRGLLPLSDVSENWPYPSYTVSWLAKDKHFLVFPISQSRTLNVVGFVSRPESELGGLKESWKSFGPRDRLEKDYEGWEETVQKIIQSMEPTVAEWRLNDRELLSQWCYLGGKVVLSGDAAHAMLPHQG